MRDGDSVGGEAMRTLHVADLRSNDVMKQESKSAEKRKSSTRDLAKHGHDISCPYGRIGKRAIEVGHYAVKAPASEGGRYNERE